MSTSAEQRAEMVYKSTLKSRFGLTDKLILLLGDPDKLVKNPNYKSGPPAGLYLVERVESFIRDHLVEVDEAKAKREGRKAAAQKAVATKTREIVAFASSVDLGVVNPLPSLEKLREIARTHAFECYGADAREPGYIRTMICREARLLELWPA